MSLYGTWGIGGVSVIMKLMLLGAPYVMKSFVSDPGVSCLLPESRKL